MSTAKLFLIATTVWAAMVNAAPAEEAVTLGDNKNFTIGPYLAYLAPFNKGTLVAGKDFTESMTIHPRSFPNDTLIEWRWPTKPSPKGIYNFDAIDFGNVNSTVVQRPIPPRKISDIKTLSQTHSFVLSGDLTVYDVITDMFLSTKSGDQTTKANEIEIFWHTPPYSIYYFYHSEGLGTFTSSGVTWKVAIDRHAKWPDILVVPANNSDVTEGTFDIKPLFAFLASKGVISNDLYFNGMAFGVEVRAGKGSAAIKRFEVEYK